MTIQEPTEATMTWLVGSHIEVKAPPQPRPDLRYNMWLKNKCAKISSIEKMRGTNTTRKCKVKLKRRPIRISIGYLRSTC